MKIKRILSVIIAVCMMLSLVPAPLAAANDAATSYEYLTSFKGLNALENMYVVDRGATFNNPLTGTSATVNFNTDPVLRNLGGTKRLLANNTLMNRNATCAVGKDGKECTPFAVMNLDKTVPWDVVVNAGNAVEITSNNIADGFMQKLFEVARYGNKNSGWFLALRLNVPTTGRFSLEMDAYADASGVVPAIYFFKDDGTVKDDASARTALRNNEPVGYHDFSGTEDSEYKAVADVNIASPGDYILIIFPDDTSAAKNANTISGKYQYMNLQGIRLTPLAGEYEYLTSFKAVDVLGKMYALSRGETFNNPLTGESKTVDFNTDPVLRNLGGSNRLLANFGLMNRNATCSVDKNGNKCEPFKTMNLDNTTAWDVIAKGGTALEITTQKVASGCLSKVFEVKSYGSKNSGWFVAMRLNVPSAGKYNLSMDSYGDASGVVPAIYFFADDGSVTDEASVRAALRSNEPVGYHDFSDIQTNGYKSVAKVDVKKPGDYVLIIFPDDTSAAKNTTVASGYQYMYLKGIKLSPVAGEFDKVILSIDGIEEGMDPVPLNTTSKLSLALVDSRDMIIDDASEEDIFVEYSSTDRNIVTVDEKGNIEAVGAGETTVNATVTYDGITRSAEYKVLVAPAGKNLMAHLNPTLEEDKWVWISERNDEAPVTPKFMRTGIGVAPKADNENNRAFGITFDPNVALQSDPASIYLALDGSRVEVKAGKFYQLSFKMKADYAVPQNASDISLLLDMFAYNNTSGTSSSNLPINIGRNMYITKTPLWQEICNDWTEVIVPVAAPTETAGGRLYLTPRIMLDFNNADFGKNGYEGTIWFDDFELHEVGYAGVEVDIQGEATAINQGGLTVIAKPYTTTGQYISISSDCLPGIVKFDTTDKYVIGDFKNIQRIEKAAGHGIFWTSASVNMGGKNGTADVLAEMTLNGVTRTGSTSVTTSGFGIKLLYAEAESEAECIEAGAATKIITAGYLSDGTEADLTDAVITYKSLTPDIVKVDGEGNVTALRAGKGQVRVSVILENSSVIAVADVTVTDSSPIKEATLSGPATVGYLRDEQLVINGVTENDFAADISAATVRWFIDSDPENGVSVSEDGKIFGKTKNAVATIYAEVELNGSKATTNSITVTVTESDLRDFVIDFTETSKGKPTDVKLSEDGWEINLSKSHSSVTGSVFRSYGLYGSTNAVGRDLVVDVNVPYTGFYTLWFTGGVSNSAADHSSIYIDGVYAGEYGFCQSTVVHPDARQLRTVYLEAGVHQFTFRPDRTNTVATNYAQILKMLRFAAVKELATISDIECADVINIAVGETEALGAKAAMSDGFVFEWQKTSTGNADPHISAGYESADENVASVSADGIITAKAIGETTVKIAASVNGQSVEKTVVIKVTEAGISGDDKVDGIEIKAKTFVMSLDSAGITLEAVGKTISGNSVELDNSGIVWESSDETVARVDGNGKVTPVSEGTAEISATATVNEEKITGKAVVSVRTGKTARTYYSEDAVAVAQENVKKYNWAKEIRDAAVKEADRYVDIVDRMWNTVPGEGLPRGQQVTLRDDPQKWTCHYCGVNLYTDYGSYPWIANPISRPWKVQCPDCKRIFPSNDFAKLYELGRDDRGIYNERLAIERNAKLVEETNGEENYLRNDLYPEIGTEKHPQTVKLSSGEDPQKWGVDSGFGYDTGRVWSNGVREVHTYVSYYIYFGLWFERGSNNPGVIQSGLNALADAYIYTGDKKYGRAGAIILDRVADVYPDMVVDGYANDYAITDGGSKVGVIIGRTWDAELATDFARVYDAFFPMYDDAQVINFLSEKSEKYDIGDKSTPEAIRQNIENGILKTIYDRVQTSHIHGNFGMSQSACGMAAVVLDTYPETDEMIDWIFRYGEGDSRSYNRGGDINYTLLELVSRDGQGDESAPGYNRIWINELESLATTLARYTDEQDISIYRNPKYLTMIKSYAPLTLVRRGLPAIGDSGQTATYSLLPDNTNVMVEAFKYSGDIEIAQHLYFIKDGNVDGMHYDIFTKNPENLAKDIKKVIDTYGEYNYDRSSLLSGYGLSVLRSGTLHKSTTSNVLRDTQRDFWMYFGGSVSHSNEDMLNLGVEAYGIGMSTDLGYPEATGSDPNRIQWQNATISHNTVVVNEKSQLKSKYSYAPLHFEGRDGRVKVMDVDASGAYTETDEYRRTVVMIDYDSDVSYGIDFFKVRGGNDHLYSFHANSSINPETSDNLEFEVQVGGSYAGVDVPFGEDPNTVSNNAYAMLKYPLGYTWLENVRRADNPGVRNFYVDYKIEDFRNQSRNGKMDVHMRMTMLNDFEADEVTLATGMPPRKPENLNFIDCLQYMLVRRKGRDLNTLFTTVVEPYNGERYIKSIEDASVEAVDGNAGTSEKAKAVKVEFVDGRVDYIVYSENKDVTYRVADIFDFKGFVGVWSVNSEGENIYSYIHDGEKMAEKETDAGVFDAAIKGVIIDFQKEHSSDNWIEVSFDAPVKAETLKDRMISVERKEKGNSVYMIKGAEMLDETHARLDLGNITLINGFKDVDNEDLGYTYDVSEGKKFVIPMSYEFNAAPVFDEIGDELTASAGSSLSIRVNAKAQLEEDEITYSARTLPRGASFDPATATVMWKPTSSQIGDNLFAIDAKDEAGRLSTLYFTVKVYGSTTGGGGGSSAPSTPGTSTPTIPATKPEDKPTTTPTTPTEPSTPATPETDKNVRFIDLGAHAWAADAINALADEGIIKGTSENTFSPAANITRADFAILLVRAFKLESDSTENFADVADSDYFAKELAIARNTGIVNGIGDNKYAPKNNITRQDMMVIVYRALTKLGVELESADVDYADFAEVADYAKDAVKALITSGLVNGKSGKIAPKDYTTRAEVAVLLKRILDYSK